LFCTHANNTKALHDRNLNVLGTRLDDLEKRLDGELDGRVALKVLGVVLLEELANSLGRTTNGTSLRSVCMLKGRSHTFQAE
jgi:hypothetical protein